VSVDAIRRLSLGVPGISVTTLGLKSGVTTILKPYRVIGLWGKPKPPP